MDIFGIIGKKKLFGKDHRNAKMPREVKLRGIKKKRRATRESERKVANWHKSEYCGGLIEAKHREIQNAVGQEGG